ncbi:hypothetical protein NH340_JMT00440 [Sarcoptes scabiei]|nr:hypothetical protein NH340_JMT00440 [Sarcoptes scabiei]
MESYHREQTNLDSYCNGFSDTYSFHCQEDSYDSDRIDSDIEDTLFTSIHHQTIDLSDCEKLDRKENNDQTPFKTQHHCQRIISKALDRRKIGSKSKVIRQKIPSKLDHSGTISMSDISYGNIANDDGLISENNVYNESNKFFFEDDEDDDDGLKPKTSIKRIASNKRYWLIDDCDRVLFRDRSRSKKSCKYCFSHDHKDCRCPNKIKVCYICGDDDHLAKSCAQKLICPKCFQNGHQSKHCPSTQYCSICKIKGHSEQWCNWRNYLSITDENDLVDSTRSQLASSRTNSEIKYCFQCGSSGHFGFDCKWFKLHLNRYNSPASSSKRKSRNVTNHSNQVSKPNRNKSISKFKQTAIPRDDSTMERFSKINMGDRIDKISILKQKKRESNKEKKIALSRKRSNEILQSSIRLSHRNSNSSFKSNKKKILEQNIRRLQNRM